MSALRKGAFDFRPGMHKPRRVRGGLITLAIVFAFFYFAATGGNIPFLSGGGYTVRAEFSTGVDLRPAKTPVRVGGVDVGQVTGVSRNAAGNAVVVTMNITAPNLHLTNLARAHVYWRTLLGFQFYVQLTPGTGSSPLGNAVIPLSRTGTQVEIDQILASLTPPSRAGIQQTFQQLGIGFSSGSQAGAAIDALAPSMNELAPGISALRGTQPGDLANSVTQANRLVKGLVGSDATLANLVSESSATLAATNAQQASIGATLRDGPQTLSDTSATMLDLSHTLNILDPVTERLLPGVNQISPASTMLVPALRQLNPLLNEARPTLVSLRPALAKLSSASVTGVPLLTNLMPTLNRLNGTIIPSLQATDPSTGLKLYEAIGPAFATVENSTKMYDANGHVQRFHALAGGAQTIGALPCALNVSPVSVNCNDLTAILKALAGG